MQKLKPAYSLMEMMIVIIIIAIFLSLLRPTYRQYTQRARFLEVVQTAMPLKIFVSQCVFFTDSLRSCRSGSHGIPQEQPFPNAGLVARAFVRKGGIIHVIPKNKYGFDTTDELIMTPELNHGHLIWKISGQAVQKGYLYGH